jgi:Tubulin-tyrosine ligase family
MNKNSSSRTTNEMERLREVHAVEETFTAAGGVVDDDDDDDKADSVEKSKRSRDDFFFRHCGIGTRQKQMIIRSSIALTATMLMLSLFYLQIMDMKTRIINRSSFRTTTTTSTFTPIPNAHVAMARRQACIATGQSTVIRAFQQRGWHVVSYTDTYGDVGGREPMKKCTNLLAAAAAAAAGATGTTSDVSVILWTKHKPYASFYQLSHPWQRHNWLPNQNVISSKGSLIRALKDYSVQTGRSIDFLPDSYVLPVHFEELLNRMLVGSNKLKVTTGKKSDASTSKNITGLDEPWVLKLAATDNGIGIAMLGPNSVSLHTLIRLLQSSSSNGTSKFFFDDVMPKIREQLVFAKQDAQDNRNAHSIQRARTRSAKLHDDIIVQRYVCNELDYHGHKFDLRVFWLIASVQPLVVLYHDGTLRVALSPYNDTDFSSTSSHLTNIGRNRVIDNCTASFAEWQVTLAAHVAANAASFSEIIRQDPLLHIRRQVMDALATVVAATRHLAFDLNGTATENGFALMGGDFIVDKDLNVWITEAQSSPGLGHETMTRKALYNRLLPSVVDIIDDVLDKQMSGKPLLPLNNTGDFELIYTDDFQYRYDFPRRLKRGPC